jgi:ABC-type multidrug transport system fused ATPase/permease subunit
MVFLALLLSLGFKAFATHIQVRFTMMQEYSIGRRLIKGYLAQPYSWFLQKNSAELGKNILSQVNFVITGAGQQIFFLACHGFTAVALLLLLVAVEPLLSLSIILGICLIYGLIYRAVSETLSRTGAERHASNDARFRAVSEAFGAVKEVKLGSLEKAYLARFDDPARIFAANQATATSISQLPRFALEGVAFGGILSVVIFLIAKTGDFSSAMPTIALFAFAGYRIMPALQGIYSSATQLRFTLPQLNALYDDLMNLEASSPQSCEVEKTKLIDQITLTDVEYTYPAAETPALKGLSLNIKAGSVVGFVGPSGSGKTTCIDLLLGLLAPRSGEFKVDGKVINSTNIRSWRRDIGYVPQQIYLSDDTIAANIALGSDDGEINMAAVQDAASIANLHDFVTSNLPLGYQTKIGERGVRLSGGQRQRIGIARALYHKPQILVLDEATSALDNLTEQLVMESVHKLGKNITVILVAHRLSTIIECDKIFLLVDGRIEAEGDYDDLIQNNGTFQAMAGH